MTQHKDDHTDELADRIAEADRIASEGIGRPQRGEYLHATIHEGDAEAVVKEKQEKALAEHVARHPEDAGRMVEDFNWILRVIMREAEAARAAGIALNGSGTATIGRSGMGKVMVKHKSR